MNPKHEGIALILLLFAVFFGGSALMNYASGRWRRPAPGKPLNRRCDGYTLADVNDYWHGLAATGNLGIERTLLRMDLLFPLLYGGTLIAALLHASNRLGHGRCLAAALTVPVVIGMLADWSENLIQLRQLSRFELDPAGLQKTWIRRASFATRTKLVMLLAATALVVFFIIMMCGNLASA